jgi:hypothetical protein
MISRMHHSTINFLKNSRKLTCSLGGAGLAGTFLLLVMASPVLSAGKQAVKPLKNFPANCVAYQTWKTVGFLADREVIGRSCHIRLDWVKVKEGTVLTVTVPIKDIHSGSSTRDEDVAEILKSDKYPNIVFQSEAFDPAILKNQGGAVMKGLLQFAGSKKPVTLHYSIKGKSVTGYAAYSFTKAGVEPPRVGPGGIIARVHDKLNFHFHIKLVGNP